MRRFDSSPLSSPGKQYIMFSLARAQIESKKTKYNLSKVTQKPNPHPNLCSRRYVKRKEMGCYVSRKHGICCAARGGLGCCKCFLNLLLSICNF